ncbi:helix-turn-helix domain-containing protein [Fodinibius saliphilus]|uniref:helix-turn-helix domain-containing protein n=1 Tax=Fodinibius saliphilus TaxID=1920650 RepID=UPI001108AC45|nr:helix-turn-helix domain-containing protein [Fodinibius saliphilus]
MSSTKYIIPYRQFNGCVVPNFLMRRREISQGAKLCYGRLSQYAGENGKAFPKQETLSKELGVSSRMIRKYLNELIDANLIEVQQKGKRRPNSYRFLRHSWMDQDDKYAQSVRNNSSTHPGTKVPPTQDYSSTTDRNNSSVPYKENHKEENHRSNEREKYTREDFPSNFKDLSDEEIFGLAAQNDQQPFDNLILEAWYQKWKTHLWEIDKRLTVSAEEMQRMELRRFAKKRTLTYVLELLKQSISANARNLIDEPKLQDEESKIDQRNQEGSGEDGLSGRDQADDLEGFKN